METQNTESTQSTLRETETPTYIGIKNYTDAEELSKNENMKNVDPNDNEAVLSIAVFKSVEDTPRSTIVLLENLTGVDLSTNEKLYDYYKLSLKMTKTDIGKFMLASISDTLKQMVEQSSVSDIKEMIEGLESAFTEKSN